MKTKNLKLPRKYEHYFSDEKFESLEITLISYKKDFTQDIIPLDHKKIGKIVNSDDILGRFSEFFSEVFPEETRRIHDPVIAKGAIYEFSEKSKKYIFVPYQHDHPEFDLVNVKKGENGDFSLINIIAEGAMSRHVPPLEFFEMWTQCNRWNLEM